MFIDSLQLVNFRNYQKQNLRFKNGVNVFVGDNGQGKTNLLEAIYSLTKGTSFRPGKSDLFINKKSDLFKAMIQGIIESDNLKNLVRLEFDQNKKTILLNQKRTNSIFLHKSFPAILFSPESLASIKEGPDHRRQLLDEWLISHNQENYKRLSEFRKILKNRNKVLKSLKNHLINEDEGFRLLSTINELFLEKSVNLIEARLKAIDSVEPLLENAMKEISQFSEKNVDISVDYLVSGESARHKDRKWVYNALNLRLKDLTQREIETGHSLIGPQKHDIKFLFEGQDSRFFCSQGQQRALILSFKMAQIMYHYRVYQSHPILLLDDVLSELDPKKRKSLLDFVKQIKSQIFITTTDLDFQGEFGDELAIFEINDGAVTKTSEST